ncbi:AraC-type DNA-binding protein [Tenacibaculum sp. MAR_2009_124]|uniref:helix-turn-helix domain-containing protein n=1 Tax=Tenacibaculum sp. MAR_2009_124 TaxID=1250059 RepID=UPI00089572FF|nr:helix-turn-helix domain-containing protein [Tenacibaculum sp. MAR_2009_124]SEB44507.1 AraC-type DNA-binding protein [Tenacibaculum sp. MAR_2009_124]
MKESILFFFCSLGVFNGFLLSLYFLFFNKVKRAQNTFLGILLLMLSIRIGKSVYIVFTEKENVNLTILQIGLSGCFLIGISLFYYIKVSLENIDVVPKLWKLHYLVLILIIFSIGITLPYKTEPKLWGTYFIRFIYLSWGMYLMASTIQIRQILWQFIKREKISIKEQWLLSVLSGNLLIYIAYIVGYFHLYYVATLTFSLVFYGLVVFLLFKKNRNIIFQEVSEKYSSKKIDSGEVAILITRLNDLMFEKKMYKKANLNLKELSKELEVTPHKLSQLLNDNMGKSFSQYINEFKIEEAKKLLHRNDNLTLEAIGYESGFSSKSNFYATFKKIVGKTPSEFKKSITREL